MHAVLNSAMSGSDPRSGAMHRVAVLVQHFAMLNDSCVPVGTAGKGQSSGAIRPSDDMRGLGKSTANSPSRVGNGSASMRPFDDAKGAMRGQGKVVEYSSWRGIPMKLTVHNGFAAHIEGIDLRSETTSRLIGLYDDFGVICWKDQYLAPPDMMKFISLMGVPFMRQISKFRLQMFPYVGTQTTNDLPRNAEGKLVVQGEGWHADHSNLAKPPRFSALSGFLCPKKGGQTPFIDTVGAYKALPVEWKRKLNGVRAFHQYASGRSAAVRVTPGQNDTIEESMHPVVITNASGKPSIYWSPIRTEKYEGISQAEGLAMEAFLEKWLTSGQFDYLHQWQEGDFVMWDNFSLAHCALPNYDPSKEFRFLFKIMLRSYDQGEQFKPYTFNA